MVRPDFAVTIDPLDRVAGSEANPLPAPPVILPPHRGGVGRYAVHDTKDA
ncbi:MAG: hypothetical protein ACLGHG_09260 [Gammaproteobacteria bacterium]